MLCVQQRPCAVAPRPCVIRQQRLVVANYSFGEKLKQALDFGKNDRIAVINKMYYGDNGTPSRQKLQEVLSDNFKMGEEGFTRKFSKDDYIRMVCDVTLPAIPDFKWGHATNGDVDDDGFCIVAVQASGHHTGGPLKMPGLEPLPPSGKHFCLAEEIQKVKVQGNKVVEVEVLPQKGAGPRALYQALGGKIPVEASVAAPPMP